MKDRVFIFIAIALIVLFAASILENVSMLPRPNLARHTEIQSRQVKDLIRLEQAGLEPQEAKYYRVIDE